MKKSTNTTPDVAIETAATLILRTAKKFYEDPKNRAEFEAWLAKRQKSNE